MISPKGNAIMIKKSRTSQYQFVTRRWCWFIVNMVIIAMFTYVTYVPGIVKDRLLVSAVKKSDNRTVKKLLQDGANPNCFVTPQNFDDDKTVLVEAVFLCNVDTVRLLLMYGSDPDYDPVRLDDNYSSALNFAIIGYGHDGYKGVSGRQIISLLRAHSKKNIQTSNQVVKR